MNVQVVHLYVMYANIATILLEAIHAIVMKGIQDLLVLVCFLLAIGTL